MSVRTGALPLQRGGVGEAQREERAQHIGLHRALATADEVGHQLHLRTPWLLARVRNPGRNSLHHNELGNIWA